MPGRGAVVCYEQGNGMASKDVCFAASIRHLVPEFSFLFSIGVLVPFQWAAVGGRGLWICFLLQVLVPLAELLVRLLGLHPSFVQICLCLAPSLAGALPCSSLCFLVEVGPPYKLLKIMNFLSSCVLETKGCCVQPLSLLCAGAL